MWINFDNQVIVREKNVLKVEMLCEKNDNEETKYNVYMTYRECGFIICGLKTSVVVKSFDTIEDASDFIKNLSYRLNEK